MNDFHGDACPTTLHAQLSTFRVLMKGNDIQCFDDILSAIQSMDVNERQFIDFVVTLCKLIHVNSATSASGERFFSTARRGKTWLRSKMTQAHFTQMAILNTHKEKLDKISLVSVANAFVSLTLSYLGGIRPLLFFLHHPKTAQGIKLKLSDFKDTTLRHFYKSNQFVTF